MTWAGRLTAAIEAAKPECIECGNRKVTVEYRPALDDFIPVSHHWARTPEDACPVLSGGLAAWACHEDLWAALEPYLFLPEYGAEAWARRELVSA